MAGASSSNSPASFRPHSFLGGNREFQKQTQYWQNAKFGKESFREMSRNAQISSRFLAKNQLTIPPVSDVALDAVVPAPLDIEGCEVIARPPHPRQLEQVVQHLPGGQVVRWSSMAKEADLWREDGVCWHHGCHRHAPHLAR